MMMEWLDPHAKPAQGQVVGLKDLVQLGDQRVHAVYV
jgi:hypothetical protein